MVITSRENENVVKQCIIIKDLNIYHLIESVFFKSGNRKRVWNKKILMNLFVIISK